MRDAGGQRQMERQHIGSLEKGDRRRAESLLLGRGQEAGHEASWQGGRQKQEVGKGARTGESDSKTGWQTGALRASPCPHLNQRAS